MDLRVESHRQSESGKVCCSVRLGSHRLMVSFCYVSLPLAVSGLGEGSEFLCASRMFLNSFAIFLRIAALDSTNKIHIFRNLSKMF